MTGTEGSAEGPGPPFDFEREAAAAALTPRPGRGRPFVERVTRYLGSRVKVGLISAAVGFGIGWFANVMVMARNYDGFVVPSGSAAAGEGNMARGSMFWFVFAAVVSAVINYRLVVGGERFWRDVRGFPDTVRTVLRTDGDTALVHVLWGFAGATVIGGILGRSLSGAVAVGLLVSMASVVRPVLTGALMSGWRWVLKRLAPDRAAQAAPVALTVGVFGAVAAMAFGFLAPDDSIRLFAGVAAAAAAWFISHRAATAGGTAAVIAVIAVAAVAAVVLGMDAAFADDGGWRECGGSLSSWLGCGGSDRVRWLAVFGGGASGAGAFLGAGVADAAGAEGPPKPWTEMTTDEREAAINDILERWKGNRPDHTPEQLQRFLEGLHARDATWWDTTMGFASDFWSAYKEDVASGCQAAGMWETVVGGWEGFTGAAGTTWDQLKASPEFLQNLASAYWDDVSSGEQLERMKSILAMGDEYIRMAGEFYGMSQEERAAAYDKFGKESVDGFVRTMRDFDQALQGKDPDEIRRAIGQLAGAAEFEALSGGLLDKGIKVVRSGGLIDDLVPPTGPGRADILYGPEGTALTPDDLVKVGVDPKRAEALIEEMKRTGGEVWLKPGSEDAVAWREQGAAGKPEWMKSKSGSPYDEYIGLGQSGDSGLVRYGVPDPPAKPPGMSDAQWQETLPEVESHYAARLQEYHDMAAVMNKAQSEGMTMMIDGVEQHVRVDWKGGGTLPNGQSFGDGVVYAITDDGRKIPVAGDVDIFTYKGPGSLDQALPGIQRADPGVVHHADTPNWQPADPKLQKVRDGIVHGASTDNPNAQNLIRISGEGIETVRWPGPAQ